MVHACNPHYSGGRDQEDRGLKPTGLLVHKSLSQKPHHKNRAGGVAQVKALSSNPSTVKKNNNNKLWVGVWPKW
jgi:hypothetical protein